MAFLEFYKKGQGSLGRLLALGSCFALLAWGGYRLWIELQGSPTLAEDLLVVPHLGLEIDLALLISLVVTIASTALVTWVLNRPRMVDLLIETEAEMKKVSWPSRQEAWNSSIIVVVTVIVMMSLLFVYDLVLNFVMNRLFGA